MIQTEINIINENLHQLQSINDVLFNNWSDTNAKAFDDNCIQQIIRELNLFLHEASLLSHDLRKRHEEMSRIYNECRFIMDEQFID